MSGLEYVKINQVTILLFVDMLSSNVFRPVLSQIHDWRDVISICKSILCLDNPQQLFVKNGVRSLLLN